MQRRPLAARLAVLLLLALGALAVAQAQPGSSRLFLPQLANGPTPAPSPTDAAAAATQTAAVGSTQTATALTATAAGTPTVTGTITETPWVAGTQTSAARTATAAGTPTVTGTITETPWVDGTQTAEAGLTATSAALTATTAGTDVPTGTATQTPLVEQTQTAGAIWTATVAVEQTATAQRATDYALTATSAASPSPTPTGTAAPSPTPTTTLEPGSGPGGRVRVRPVAVGSEAGENPDRYVLVLDVSGSQNLDFRGVGSEPGTAFDVQCDPGPNGVPHQNCGVPQYAWRVVEERRIYVQKQAAIHFIDQLNMPGNPGYDATRPQDRVTLVWYNQQSPASWVYHDSSNPSALRSAVLSAGSVQGDPYKTDGGSNWAAGLLRAYQALAAAPASTSELGQSWDYDEQVIFFADSVSNVFLDPNPASSLNGGQSSSSTYPNGSACRALGENVVSNAPCQTTDVGGSYNGMDRPITQAVRVAREQLMALPGRPVDVYAIAISNALNTGLEGGVASVPANYYWASGLTRSSDGTTNVDRILDDIFTKSRSAGCRAVSPAGWVEQMALANIPTGLPFTAPAVGELELTSLADNSKRYTPILREPQTGRLVFRFNELPPGDYRLAAALGFRGDDGVTRIYSQFYAAEQIVWWTTVSLNGGSQDLGMLSLVLAENVCQAP